MKISMIAAMANNRIIGKDKQMPWHLPADLKHFKATTLGKPVIMGRKTYESIGKALPGRTNIVITNSTEYTLSDAQVVNSCESALKFASQDADEVMIIGGGAIYEAFLPIADQLFLTFIDLTTIGDTLFPDYEKVAKWHVSARESHHSDEKNSYNYEFVTLIRQTTKSSSD
jgi:dihydrofolate reductase